MPTTRRSVPASRNLSAAEAWLDILPAGALIEFVAQGPAVGIALFAWALADAYEQLSDATTFMELRRVRPIVGDHLYATLRRPIMTLARDDVGEAVDLLRHDIWWPRDRCLDVVLENVKSQNIPAPRRCDWPYAINLFARTGISDDGDLIDDPPQTTRGDRIALRARFDIVVAAMAAGPLSPAIDIRVE